MKARFRMNNNTHMIEFAKTKEGLLMMKAFRKEHPDFKYKQIKSVIQAYPDKIECGKVYPLT